MKAKVGAEKFGEKAKFGERIRQKNGQKGQSEGQLGVVGAKWRRAKVEEEGQEGGAGEDQGQQKGRERGQKPGEGGEKVIRGIQSDRRDQR